MRLVLDTSVLITALRSPDGAAARLVELVLDGRVTLLMNLAIACEYRDVASRPEQLSRFHLPLEQVDFLIDELEALSEGVEITTRYRPLSADPDDDLVLELAINGRADTIVSNNIRHLRPAARGFGIGVFEAGTILKTLKGA
jgi:putative PIN family toxin of toxin-antitoxin system